MKKTFNPEEWGESQQTSAPQHTTPRPSSPSNSSDDIEIVTQRIEAAGVDITGDYASWRDLGFALSDELGENGRDYFHRISRFYPGYTEKEADDQYDKCMRAHGTGITIRTFFQAAKDAGISVSVPSKNSTPSHTSFYSSGAPALTRDSISANEGSEGNDGIEGEEELPLPSFSVQVHDLLPGLFRKIADQSESEQDGDILLLGSLTVISAVLPNVSGIYNKRPVWSNLFLFVTARASSGKGRLTLCKYLIDPVHDRLREINEAEEIAYKQNMQEYNANKKKMTMEQPEKPPLRMLIIPANSSATAVYQVLGDNDGQGIMFETEGDTLANTFSSDYGNYSDGFRKAFHHENISYVRRKDREYVNLKHPRLSALLTGTPKQVQSLITDAENGLFSRFMFYFLPTGAEWQDVFALSENGTVDDYFKDLGSQFFDFYNILKETGDVHFHLTPAQQDKFNGYFKVIHEEYPQLLGDEIIASVRRLGLITFRIAMILSTVRMMDEGDFGTERVCSDDDFQAAMIISKALLQHTARVFRELPRVATQKAAGSGQKTVRRQLFLDALPDEFDRQTFIDISSRLGMPLSTAERNIKKWTDEGLLIRQDLGHYKKQK
ncbi:MAG: DUF3987 domain-containing protein [Bacteroidales bacterium]|nr:DUF3987 domain-containing protein [Bacteroidales bacterium]MBP3235623.1 DUF3987 domain-containing protein [Bacteroidales bacterium]